MVYNTDKNSLLKDTVRESLQEITIIQENYRLLRED